MVTANRAALARRAITCFVHQRWANRELVIVDDGEADYSPLFAGIPADRIAYHKVARRPETTLGALRNLSLNLARGDLIAQWDDDDWYHPDRLAVQAAALGEGSDVCLLAGTLMHLDSPRWFDHPYIGTLRPGVPGTIVHRANFRARYPDERRGEDTVFLDNWPRAAVRIIEAPHLFVRAFHGSNTWEAHHFTRRIRNTPAAAIEYVWRRFVTRNLHGHSRFRMGTAERDAFARFIADSKRAGIFA
nr:glycosyltransferase family 2 protein [Stakelama flava]